MHPSVTPLATMLPLQTQRLRHGRESLDPIPSSQRDTLTTSGIACQHAAVHPGQTALLRPQLGGTAMRYALPVGMLALALACAAPLLSAQEPAPTPQVTSAVLPLPPSLRDGAAVVQLGADGVPRTLRPGSNGMICLADAPGDTLFDVRCYHRDFMPAIYRRRALRFEGLDDSAAVVQMDREIREGRLIPRPWSASAGYRMLGPLADYDPAGNTAGDRIDRWQSLHLPYATAEQLGVSETEDGIQPYLMSAGTWWAHVMIMERPLRY